jgi:hypothetical protein
MSYTGCKSEKSIRYQTMQPIHAAAIQIANPTAVAKLTCSAECGSPTKLRAFSICFDVHGKRALMIRSFLFTVSPTVAE